MLKIVLSNRFKKDLKLAKKRGLNLDILEDIVNKLAMRGKLPDKNRDHGLTGDYIGFRECHVAPDWLLVYRVEEDELELFLFRTGTHSDLLVNSCSKKREGLPLVFSHHPRQKNLTVVNIGTDLVVVYIQKFRLLHDSSGRQVIELTDSLSDGIRICIAISNTSVSETR